MPLKATYIIGSNRSELTADTCSIYTDISWVWESSQTVRHTEKHSQAEATFSFIYGILIFICCLFLCFISFYINTSEWSYQTLAHISASFSRWPPFARLPSSQLPVPSFQIRPLRMSLPHAPCPCPCPSVCLWASSIRSQRNEKIVNTIKL